jgi:hypothetical protein
MSANCLRGSNSIPVDNAADSSAFWGVGKRRRRKGGYVLFAVVADEEEKTKLTLAILKTKLKSSLCCFLRNHLEVRSDFVEMVMISLSGRHDPSRRQA